MIANCPTVFPKWCTVEKNGSCKKYYFWREKPRKVNNFLKIEHGDVQKIIQWPISPKWHAL
jgi:hypothetical protein